MPTHQVCNWAENTGVGVNQWAADTMGIGQDKGGLTTQRIDNEVRECVREISQSTNIINKLGDSSEQWDILSDHCITRISDLESQRPLWKRYMADESNLDGQTLKAALAWNMEVGLRLRNHMIEETPTKQRKFVYIQLYFIAPMLLLPFLMVCRYRRWRGTNLWSQVFADKGALQFVNQCPRRAI